MTGLTEAGYRPDTKTIEVPLSGINPDLQLPHNSGKLTHYQIPIVKTRDRTDTSDTLEDEPPGEPLPDGGKPALRGDQPARSAGSNLNPNHFAGAA